jgi:hypothetical protein
VQVIFRRNLLCMAEEIEKAGAKRRKCEYMKKKILFAGNPGQATQPTSKALILLSCVYEEGIEYIAAAIEKAGYELCYLPGQYVAERFPRTPKELSGYACVVLSDIGSNTLLLSDDTFKRSLVSPNRCQSVRDYVLGGGAFLMIGGYYPFPASTPRPVRQHRDPGDPAGSMPCGRRPGGASGGDLSRCPRRPSGT